MITYILLCGYPPFYGDSDTEIFDSVRTGRFDFPSPEWDTISSAAKTFVQNLLHKESKARPTAKEAMQMEWIVTHTMPAQPEQHQNQKSIMTGTARGTTFKKYLAMQKLKKAALVTIAKNLTHEEVGSLQDIFRQVDQTGGGILSLTELNDAMSRGRRIFQDLVNCP